MSRPLVPVSYYIIVFVLVALAIHIWRARRHNPVNRSFALFAVSIACWVAGIGSLHVATSLDAWGRVTFASAVLIPATFVVFTSWYPRGNHWAGGYISIALPIVGIAIAVLTLATPLLVYDVSMVDGVLHRRTGPLYPVFSLYFAITWIVAIAIFVRQWSTSQGLARAQYQYLGAAIAVSGAGATVVNLALPLITGKSTYSWLGPYFAVVLVAVIGHAIIRHRLMDLRPVILRGLAYLVMTVMAYVSLLAVLGVAVPGWLASLPGEAVMGIAVLALTVSPPVRLLFGRLIEPYLYRRGLDHEAFLGSVTQRLGRLMDTEAFAAEAKAILDEAFIPTFIAIAARPSPSLPFEQLSLSGDVPFRLNITHVLRLFDSVPAPVVVLASESTERFRSSILAESGCELAVALYRREQLLGVMLVGPRRSGDPYFARDIALLESVARLASIALENAYLYGRQRELMEYSDRLLESLDTAVVAVDTTGTLTSINSAAARLFGIAPTSCRIDMLPSDVGWALALAVGGGWQAQAVECKVEHPAKGQIPALISAATLRTNETVSGALAVVTDLSAVKELERNQRRVERLSSMARFYAGLAHEIRTPLASISTFVSMLHDRFDDPEYRESAVRLLPLEVQRIVKLADRLRLMAPSEDARLQPIDLFALVSDILSLHGPRATDAGVEIVLRCDNNLPHIEGDGRQLTQLFVNLLSNAIDAMPQGGRVLIEIAKHHAGRSRFVIARITDHGTGIDPAVTARLFEPFFTTKPTGTGLGLAICREIAEFHNAGLTLTSRADGVPGAIATIEFPVRVSDVVDAKNNSLTLEPAHALFR
jgi:signal transduction histidine kinase